MQNLVRISWKIANYTELESLGTTFWELRTLSTKWQPCDLQNLTSIRFLVHAWQKPQLQCKDQILLITMTHLLDLATGQTVRQLNFKQVLHTPSLNNQSRGLGLKLRLAVYLSTRLMHFPVSISVRSVNVSSATMSAEDPLITLLIQTAELAWLQW